MSRLSLFRGDIWLVALDPTIGHEQAKTRPCLIISVDSYNSSMAQMITVLPLTSKKHDLPWHIPVSIKETGLRTVSYIICDQVRTISKKRLVGEKPFGRVLPIIMQAVEERLRILLKL